MIDQNKRDTFGAVFNPTPVARLNNQPAISSHFGQDRVFILMPLASTFKPQQTVAFAGVRSTIAVGRDQKRNRAIFRRMRGFVLTS